MNQTSQKSKGLPAWGDTKVINTIQQHYIVYSYYLHKKNLDQIKVDSNKKMIDNSEPQAFKEKSLYNLSKQNPKLQPLGAPKNKPQREKNLEQDIENGSLVSRMLQITEKGSLYNKDLLEKQQFKPDKNKYATHRKTEAEKVSKENQFIYNRLEKVQSTINFNQYQKQYTKFKKYRDNITRSSRRIFNCFIKTELNQELLATSSTAYGRFSHLSHTQSIQATPQQKQSDSTGKDKLTFKKRPKQSRQIKTEGSEVNFHKFPEDDHENTQRIHSQQSQKQSKQVEKSAEQNQKEEQKNSKQEIKSQRNSQSSIKESTIVKKNSIEEQKKNNSNSKEIQKNKSIPSEENIPENRHKQSSSQSNTQQGQNQDENQMKIQVQEQPNEKKQESPTNTSNQIKDDTKIHQQQNADQQQQQQQEQQQIHNDQNEEQAQSQKSIQNENQEKQNENSNVKEQQNNQS